MIIIHYNNAGRVKEAIDVQDKRKDIITAVKNILIPITPKNNNQSPTYAKIANNSPKVTLSREMTQITNGVSLGKRPARRKLSPE